MGTGVDDEVVVAVDCVGWRLAMYGALVLVALPEESSSW